MKAGDLVKVVDSSVAQPVTHGGTKMKAGDLVKVVDSSWAMTLSNGRLSRSGDLRPWAWRVLETGGSYPTSELSQQIHQANDRCDTMLVADDDSTLVAFVMGCYCKIIPPPYQWQVPTVDTPIDTPVWVRRGRAACWRPRYHAGVFGGVCFAWEDGKTSFTGRSNVEWTMAVLADPDDFTREPPMDFVPEPSSI